MNLYNLYTSCACVSIALMLSVPSLAQERATSPSPEPHGLVLKHVIRGSIRPKSIGYSGQDLFLAQNMMYRHSITVYDTSLHLVKTIPDRVRLADFGHKGYEGSFRGAPVEVAFSHGGRYAWVSNYQMEGPGFEQPGSDKCVISDQYDHSYVYQLDLQTLEIIAVVAVGSVPKFLKATPDDRYVLVSNWCSGDLSVIDTRTKREVRRLDMGRYPRGIAVHPMGSHAYVSIMGSQKLAVVDLQTFEVSWFHEVGHHPRHVCISPDGNFLYLTLNSEGKVAKLDAYTGQVLQTVQTGRAPRSMVCSPGGDFLYVVNYFDDNLSKIRSSDMEVVQTLPTHVKPIGITLDPQRKQVWVACYPGSLMVFEDPSLEPVPLLSTPLVLGPSPDADYLSDLYRAGPSFEFITARQLDALQAQQRATATLRADAAPSLELTPPSQGSSYAPKPISSSNPSAEWPRHALTPQRWAEICQSWLPPGQGPRISAAQLAQDRKSKHPVLPEQPRVPWPTNSRLAPPSWTLTRTAFSAMDSALINGRALRALQQGKFPSVPSPPTPWPGDSLLHVPQWEASRASLQEMAVPAFVRQTTLEALRKQRTLALADPGETSEPATPNPTPMPPSTDAFAAPSPPMDEAGTPPAPPVDRHPYHLIVGSFSIRENAEHARETFSSQGFAPLIIPLDEDLFRLSVASFQRYQEAQTARKRLLTQQKVNSWVLTR